MMMLANYLVLINNKLADLRNFPELVGIVEETATFFWGKDARNYQRRLLVAAPMIPSKFVVELRKI